MNPRSEPARTAIRPRPDVLRTLWEQSGMLAVVVLAFAAACLFVPYFASGKNLVGLLLSVTTIGMVACTMLLCLAAGDFDLSVGSVVAMGGVLAAVVTNHTQSALLGLAAGVLAGGLVGVLNGVVIAWVGINALITTLATMQIVRGLCFIVTDGVPEGIRVPAFYALGTSSWLGLQAPIWMMCAAFAAFGFVLNRTVFGRNALAIGGNAEAARLAGVPVRATKVAIFTLQGLVAGFAGVVLAARLTSGQPNTAYGLELQVISACVLGGVSLSGGVGTMTGVIAGVLFMGMIKNSMDLLNIDAFYQQVATGVILLAAVIFDRSRRRA